MPLEHYSYHLQVYISHNYVMYQTTSIFPLRALVTNQMMIKCFATTSSLSGSAQKAIWATAVIKKIIQGTKLNDINDLSLREAIVQLPNPSSDYKFEAAYKAQVMKLFQDGVMINELTFSQDRFRQAKNDVPADQDNDQAGNMSAFNKNKKEKVLAQESNSFRFVFCPNNLVTQQIFSILHKTKREKRLITGGFGISKSIAIILFIHLNYFPLKYYFEAKEEAREKKTHILLNELKALKQKGLLQQKFYKYFYWTVGRTKFDEGGSETELALFKDLILPQVNELGTEDRKFIENCNSINRMHMTIRTLYPEDQFIVRPIVDQINTVVSQFRRYNQNRDRVEQGSQTYKHVDRQYFEACKQMDLKIKKFLAIKNASSLQREDYILNSSVSIESEVLTPSSDSSKLSLGVDEKQRSALKRYKISYEHKLSTLAGRIDFSQIFMFEIQRFLTNKAVQRQIKKKICKMLKEKVTKPLIQSLSWFARFLYIRKYLQERKFTVNDLSLENNQAKFIKEIEQFVAEFPKKCRKDYEQQMKKFLDKGDKQAKLFLVETLYHFASCEQNIKSRPNEEFQLPAFILSQALKIKDSKIAKYLKQQDDWKHLFFAQTFDDGIAKFPWSPMQFLQFTTPIIHPQLCQSYQFFVIGKDEREFLIQYPPSRGYIIQYYLRLAMGSLSKFNMKVTKVKEARQIYQQFDIQEQLDFVPFNRKKSTPQQGKIAQNFQEILLKAQSNPEKYYFGVPYYIGSSGKRKFVKIFAFNSQAIDFAIVRYKDSLNKYEIFTFDVTIQTDVSQKMNEALKLFKQIKQNEDDKELFIHTHIVICPRQSKIIYDKFKDDDTASLVYFDDISFARPSSQSAMDKFLKYSHLVRVELLSKQINHKK